MILLVLTAIIVVWQWQPLQPLPLLVWPSNSYAEQKPSIAAQTPNPAPLVKADRLLADLRSLTFKRYDAVDRQQARHYITQALQAAGWTVQNQPFEEAGFAGVNLYAERVGTDPNAGSVLLGAHYDTVEVSPGADDNATAVATVLEAARLFGQQSTARSLQLVLFDLEERGLLGSKAFVDQFVDRQGNQQTDQQTDQQVPSDKLQAVVILDMVGYACHIAGCQTYPALLPIKPSTDRGSFLAVLGDQGHAHLLDPFNQPVQPQSLSLQLPPILTLPIPTFGGIAPDLVRSDHAPFWKQGIGAVLVTDTANFRNPHYHQASDSIETIVPDFFVGSAQIVMNAVTQLLQP